jgi:hypothetical protein
MTRILQFAERNVTIDPPNVITLAAATATFALEDISRIRGEIFQRFIQNLTGNDLYYSEGVTDANGAASCNAIGNFHGVIPSGQQLDCSGHRRCVSVYSAAGGVISTTIRRRTDTSHHN